MDRPISTRVSAKQAIAKERLRRRYRPRRVRLLFVGESPPASGRFFYQADSGLYRAFRRTFVQAFPDLENADFLESFRDMGCYLVDLCGKPVDRLTPQKRRQACIDGEERLAQMIGRLDPVIIVTVVRSITKNVRRAQQKAGWTGTRLELPYPGRWKQHREEFAKSLIPVLREISNRLHR